MSHGSHCIADERRSVLGELFLSVPGSNPELWLGRSCHGLVFSLPAGSWPVLVLLQSMALYWLSSSLVGLCHNLLLRSPAFRRLCCIPRTKSDSDTPYRDIVAALATRYSFRKQHHWAPGRAVSGLKYSVLVRCTYLLYIYFANKTLAGHIEGLVSKTVSLLGSFVSRVIVLQLQ